MTSSLFIGTVAAAIGFLTVFRRFRFHQENKENSSSLSSPPPPPSPSSPLSITKIHDVFSSFRGEDVRKDFLSHIQKEFQRKGITPFIDNNIKRGESIGLELIRAIRGSKIAIVLFSKNYASSSWCLDELVEIMKCREELGQTVIVVFYKVDLSHVKKLTGDFGKVFRNTCKGKKREDIERWRQAFAKVATIAGYDSNKWDNEAEMIEKISCDISNFLYHSTPSRDFDALVGMEAHMEKMERLLHLDSDEVRMIGIWGPSGIGKTTIARFLFSKHSHDFSLSVFMENVKGYTRQACSDDYNLKLHLHQQLISQIFKQKDIEIPHLGVAQDRLKDKKVLVILDDVDQSIQLDAMAKETRWFGPGSRIVITTQDRRLLKTHGIEHIYKVNFPTIKEALQIFCMNAFGQNSPKDGFEELALEVTRLAGELPLGLRVLGSYFKNRCKKDWIKALPMLRTHLDSHIQSILKFSYDALDDKDQDLFLHIACFFNGEFIKIIERCLEKSFPNVRQGLRILTEKSLISVEDGWVQMHNLLAQLGREIVRKQSIDDPGQRRFLVDAKETCDVLTDDTGSRNVLGMDLKFSEVENEFNISKKAFNGLSNLQFIRFSCALHDVSKVLIPLGLNNLSRKLRFLHWDSYPLTCLPSKFHTDFLVKLIMPYSKLEKLWEGIQPLNNLIWMNLSFSEDLKELPDLSTAVNLQGLSINYCSSLVKLPSSIGNATSLVTLKLTGCSELVELPSTIGNLRKLTDLKMEGCSKLKALPTNINLKSLKGSQIVVTTQDRRLLWTHRIEHVYRVGFPTRDEALQIFCMNAFGQNSPKDGFEELALEVTRLAGKLRLGLRVLGSYFKNMSKKDWIKELPMLKTHIDSNIQSVLKFSYDALDDRYKDLFLHIACFFKGEFIETVERCLEKCFPNVRQRLRILTEKSLISIEDGWVQMHNLLAQLGREIVRKQSIDDPRQCRFMVGAKEICLTDDTISY